MTWWGWVLLAVYLVGWVMAGRRFAWILCEGKPSDGFDLGMSLIFGFLAAFAWPIIWSAHHWFRFAKAHGITGAGLITPPREERRRIELQRRERELRDREWRIRDMERELGLPPEQPEPKVWDGPFVSGQ